MPGRKLKDKEIVEGIRQGENKILLYVYTKYYRLVESIVLANYGTTDNARDLFQEVIFAIYNNISAEDFVLKKNFEAYLFAITKHKWHAILNKRSKQYSLNFKKNVKDVFDNNEHDKPEEEIINLKKYKLISKHINKLDTKCRNIIKQTLKGNGAAEIANKLGFANPGSVRAKRSECMNRLRQNVEADPLFKILKDEY